MREIDEAEPTIQEPEIKLFWCKVKQTLWPCKKVGGSQELVRVKIFNDQKTELEMDVSKLKPFKEINNIPRSRTAEWKRGYQAALEEHNY